MIGTVKFFNESKGYGFITLKDNNQSDYFFHISNVASDYTLPNKMDIVTFDVEHKGDKVSAVNVSLKNEYKENEKFFKIKDTRIKLNNIKNYGIGHTKLYYEYKYDVAPEIEGAGFWKTLFHSKRINERYVLDNRFVLDKPQVKVAYFYITTYQGDNFKFFDNLSNIPSLESVGETYAQQQISRLDSILN